MKVIVPSEIARQPAPDAIFDGQVERQTLLEGVVGGTLFNAAVVTFNPGARTKWHTHTHDQLLLCTYGTGVLATEQERHEVHQGELIHIPAGEKHWHGSNGVTTFSHISLTVAGTVNNVLESVAD